MQSFKAIFNWEVNSFGAIRYFGGSLARYILCAPKYHKTRCIGYFGPLFPTIEARIEPSCRVIIVMKIG